MSVKQGQTVAYWYWIMITVLLADKRHLKYHSMAVYWKQSLAGYSISVRLRLFHMEDKWKCQRRIIILYILRSCQIK